MVPPPNKTAPISLETPAESHAANVPDEVVAPKATEVDPVDEPTPVPVEKKKPEEATEVIESEGAVPGEYTRRS